MYDKLKKYCNDQVPFTKEELALIDAYFEIRELEKKEYLLQNGKICDFVGFVAKGVIRHFHIKDGIEKTCEISLENAWVTDFQSFTKNTSCIMNLQAMEKTSVLIIRKEMLNKLYSECNKYETFGRLMVEQIVQRASEIAMSLSSDKPEERVPQKHIANFLGLNPESLSRIKNRVFKKRMKS